MEWFTLTLICALSLASADAATKRWMSDSSASEITLIRAGLAGLLLLPLVFLQPLPELPLPFWGWMLFLVPLELAALILYMRAIRDYPLSLTVPYLAFTPVFIILTGWVILGETVNLGGALGIMLVVIGSWLLNLDWQQRLSLSHLATPFRAILHNPGSRLMLMVAMIYSVTSAGGKAAMAWMPAQQFGAFYYAFTGIAALVILTLQNPASLKVFTRHIHVNLTIAALMAIMVVTHFMALIQVETAYMITVKRTSLLIGIVYGALIFGERHLTRHLFAGGLMVAGVGLIVI